MGYALLKPLFLCSCKYILLPLSKAAAAGAAKTSDDSNMYMWLVIAMAGLGVSIAALTNRKKEQA